MLLTSFIDYLRFEKRYSEHTIIAYQTDIIQFQQFIASQGLDVSDTQRNTIRYWLVSLQSKNISHRSIHRKISSVNSFYKFMMRSKLVKHNPTQDISLPKISKKIPLTISENKLEMLLNRKDIFKDTILEFQSKLIIELLYGTGIRLSELLNLKSTDIDFNQSTIRIMGKGSKERLVPVYPQLLSVIKTHEFYKKNDIIYQNCPYLISTSRGTKAYPMFINRIVKQYLSIVSTQKKVNPHLLRHSFATSILNNGGELNAIKDILGHANLAATQIYTHNTTERLKSIYKTAHPRA